MSKITPTIITLLILAACTTACHDSNTAHNAPASAPTTEKGPEGPKLLIYCGITMVKPMRELADNFERSHHCTVIMNQGGSEDLYQSLRYSKKGDLYLPGSESYRAKHLAEGLLLDCVYVGFNQAALVVPKGNPRNIQPTLDCLLNRSLAVVIGNPESCSIGKQSSIILKKAGIFDQVVDNCFSLAADSRNLNKLLRDGSADVMLNWRATGFFPENTAFVEVLDLPESVSPKKKLVLNLLSCAGEPELAREFMNYASSEKGQSVFRKWGFLTDEPVDQERMLEGLD